MTRSRQISERKQGRGARKSRPRSKKSQSASASALKANISPTDEELQVRLGYLMHDVSRLRRVVFDQYMVPLGITRSQWWVLSNLSRHDGMIQSDLANMMDLGKAALGGLVDRLEASGFLERRGEPTDRRAKRIYIAPKGEQLVKTMRSLNHDMSEEILKSLTGEQRRQLADMLWQVKKNLLVLKK